MVLIKAYETYETYLMKENIIKHFLYDLEHPRKGMITVNQRFAAYHQRYGYPDFGLHAFHLVTEKVNI